MRFAFGLLSLMFAVSASADSFAERFDQVAPVAPVTTSEWINHSIQNFSTLNKIATEEDCLEKSAMTARLDASLKETRDQLAPGPVGKAPCGKYLNEDGSLGEKGSLIAAQLDKPVYKEALMSDSAGDGVGMDIVCPKFKSLSPNQRKQFWAWTFASIARTETTCTTHRNTYKPVRGSKSMAIGEFQLNFERYMRAGRGKKWGGRNCAVADVTSDKANLLCAIDIMTGQFKGEYGKKGLLGNSYWQELKTNRKKSRLQTSPIIKNLKKFAPCGAK